LCCFLTCASTLAGAAASAAQEVEAVLAGLAAGCPPRDALPLFLEALQVSRESSHDNDDDDGGNCDGAGGSDAASASPQAWHLRTALTRGVCVLLTRAPRRRWEAAVNAVEQVLLVARDASAALSEHAAEHTAAALDAALQFSDAAASAADATAAPGVVAHALPRLLLRLLAAAAPQLPAGAAHAQLAPLRSLLRARGVISWAALDAVAIPPSRAAGDDSDDDDDDDERAARERAAAAEERHVAFGAALLAHAWLTGADDSRDDAALLTTASVLPSAAPHACTLLSGAAGVAAAVLGAELAAAAAGHALSGNPGGSGTSARIGDSDATPLLLSSLASAMARSPSPAVRERAYAALLCCLDVHAPWARLEAVRTLLRECRDPAVAALLFRRIKDDAAAAWPESPFGGPPAVRMVVDWLTDAARDAAEPAGACNSVERAISMAEGADAVIGALNALRFALLRDAGAARNASGLAAAQSLHALRADVLSPLLHAAVAAAAALAAAPPEDQCLPALLAAQTMQELCERTAEAAGAAEAACAQVSTAAAAMPTRPASGLRRGFLA
jgi:hypothetical protein